MGNVLGTQIPTVFRLQAINANLGVTGTRILPNIGPLWKRKDWNRGQGCWGLTLKEGVEADVICVAHVLVLFFCRVQSSYTQAAQCTRLMPPVLAKRVHNRCSCSTTMNVIAPATQLSCRLLPTRRCWCPATTGRPLPCFTVTSHSPFQIKSLRILSCEEIR